MILEDLDRRVLGAVRCLSAPNGLPVPGPLRISPAPRRASDPPAMPGPNRAPWRIVRNRHGLYVLHAVPGFDAYRACFDAPPDTPALGAVPVRLRIEDPSRRHLPAEVVLSLPREVEPIPPGGAPGVDSLFRPVDVPLYLAPSAPVADGWAVLRVTAWREVPDPANAAVPFRRPLRGALLLLRTTGNNPRVLGRGLTEWQRFPGEPAPSSSEALIAVPGIPVTMWSNQAEGPVLVENQEAQLELRVDTPFDPDAPDAPVPDLTRLEPPGNAALPNGVVGAVLPAALTLRARGRQALTLVLNPQNAVRLAP